jgi:hypothetical protein
MDSYGEKMLFIELNEDNEKMLSLTDNTAKQFHGGLGIGDYSYLMTDDYPPFWLDD